MNYKKIGQITDSVNAIIVLIIGVGVATLVLIFVSVLGGTTYSMSSSMMTPMGGTVSNETWNSGSAITAGTNYTIANNPITGMIGLANSTVICNSNNVTWNSSYVTLVAGYCATGKAYNISYYYGDYNAYNNVTAAIRSGFTSLNTVGGYMPIIVLAVIIFVVLSLVTALNKPSMTSGGFGTVL
jgi:hypothetical protein